MRPAALACALVALLAAVPARAATPAPGAAAYAALTAQFRVGTGLYRDGDGSAGAYSAAWPLSQALAAANALARTDSGYRGEVRSLVAALGRYWDGRAYESAILPPYGGGGAVYYDDNEWIGLDLVDAWQTLGDPALLARAEAVFALVTGGWDGSRSDPCPGGVFWGRSSTDRNAVSTENGALLALRLYAATHRRSYLDWARTMDAWTTRCLRGGDGLVRDHVRADGSVDAATWSYNQGAAIAVEALLWRETHDAAYLQRARQTAAAELARTAAFAREPRVFVAIFFRDLALLPGASPQAARAYAASLQTARSATLLDAAALADLLARLART